MKRRKFVLLSTAGALAIGSSYLYWSYSTNKFKGSPAYPESLAVIMDENAIRSVGETYRQRFPREADEAKLLGLLGVDLSYGNTDRSDIKKAIIKDFENDNTVVLDGWVVSVTEARQCALFSLQISN
tara:strand:- start:279 stop:659 length:381 start_codon:yes stop_codon:yes gene_type:complete